MVVIYTDEDDSEKPACQSSAHGLQYPPLLADNNHRP